MDKNAKIAGILLMALIIVSIVASYYILTTPPAPSFTASNNGYKFIHFEWDFHDKNDTPETVYVLFEEINGTHNYLWTFPYDQHEFGLGGEKDGKHIYTMARFNTREESLDPKNFTTIRYPEPTPSSPWTSPMSILTPSPRPCGEQVIKAYNLSNCTNKITASVNL